MKKLHVLEVNGIGIMALNKDLIIPSEVLNILKFNKRRKKHKIAGYNVVTRVEIISNKVEEVK